MELDLADIPKEDNDGSDPLSPLSPSMSFQDRAKHIEDSREKARREKAKKKRKNDLWTLILFLLIFLTFISCMLYFVIAGSAVTMEAVVGEI